MEAELLVLLVERWLNRGGRTWSGFELSPGRASTQQVEDLCHVEHHRDTGHHQHEDDEDGLLGGTRHVALYGEGTRRSGADDPRVHDEAVQIVLTHDERDLQNDSEKYGGHVGPQKVAFDLDVACLIRVLGLFGVPRVGGVIFSQLVLLADDVEHVAEVDERRRRHKDNLEDPESNVRDGEGVVVADVLTAGLFGVADHFWLFIAPNL